MNCFKCNRDLPLSMFKNQSRSGVTRRSDIPRQCLDCLRAWFTENARKVRRARGVPLKKDPVRQGANREKKKLKGLERLREWSLKNRERTLAARREGWKRFNARYPGANAAAMAKGRVRRRVGMVERTPAWGQDGISDVYLEAEYFQMEVDHIVPLRAHKASGLHVWDNLQLLTKTANRRKRNSFDPMTFNP